MWKLNKVVKPRMAGPEDENQVGGSMLSAAGRLLNSSQRLYSRSRQYASVLQFSPSGIGASVVGDHLCLWVLVCMQDWSVKYRPFSFASMLGTHHSEAVAAFESLLRREQLRSGMAAGTTRTEKVGRDEVRAHVGRLMTWQAPDHRRAGRLR